jgi:probable F420-dependent oxidoreductase
MKFAYGLEPTSPLSPELTTGEAVAEVASQAEAAGFEAGWVTDHPSPSQRWREGGGHDSLDPFITLAVMARATARLRVLTNLIVIPYRNPFLLARSSSTLDLLSGGRLILGVGVGWQKSEFAALGVSFDDRNGLFDEYMEVLRQGWSGEPVTHEGRYVHARNVTTNPAPLQQPRPPIWLGGNSKLSLRRVAAFGDGWMPMPNPRGAGGTPLETSEDLVGLLDYLHEQRAAINRTDPIDVMCIFPPDAALAADSHSCDLVRRLGQLGVTWLGVNVPGATVDQAGEFLASFGSVIEEVKSC